MHRFITLSASLAIFTFQFSPAAAQTAPSTKQETKNSGFSVVKPGESARSFAPVVQDTKLRMRNDPNAIRPEIENDRIIARNSRGGVIRQRGRTIDASAW